MVYSTFLLDALETAFKVGTRAENPPSTCQDYHFDAFVEVKNGVDLLKVIHHLNCKCILLLGPIQRDNNHLSSLWGTRWMM